MTHTHNWPVYGHDWAVEYLQKGLANERVRHAYLITGTSALGKSTLAHVFALALNCLADERRPCMQCRACKKIISGNHTDVMYAELENDRLKIGVIRAMSSWLAMKPYEGRYRVAVLPDFDKADPRAQDALLKTLEEPPPHAVLILQSTSLESILSTITSRSQIIHLRPVSAPVIQDVLTTIYQADPTTARQIARFSGGRIGWAIQALQTPDLLDQRAADLDLLEQIVRSPRVERFQLAKDLSKDKTALAPRLELWLTYWRDVLLFLEGTAVPVANIDREVQIQQLAYDMDADDVQQAIYATRRLLNTLHTNLTVQLALETLFLDYPGLD